MVKHLKILTLLLLTKFSSFGQVGYSSKIFHKHFQTCHYIGTTEEDFIIILNEDSTISITRYNTNYRDQYNAVTRQLYVGTYSTLGDTIKVKFIDQSSTTKNKIKDTNTTTHFVKKVDIVLTGNNFFQFPSTTYIINADKIFSVDGLFPTLPFSAASTVMLLESEFMNWDKRLFYKMEIFGLSK